MVNKIEAKKDFWHLWKIPPKVESIINIDPEDINSEHLCFLDSHLEGLLEQFPDIFNEISKIREDIKKAMLPCKNFIPWETMKAANNPNYRTREYRPIEYKKAA
jgi:hypothetical protein